MQFTTSKPEISLPATPLGGFEVVTGPDAVTVLGALDGPVAVEANSTATFEWSNERRGWVLV